MLKNFTLVSAREYSILKLKIQAFVAPAARNITKINFKSNITI
jgi:hypothetical protein